jgi:segregation and condensation protein A
VNDVAMAPAQQPADRPVARVYGEPLTELPHDLYIPPEALEIFLETFEGPLDLLLYLIRRQNINVLDVPMRELTRQYLGYVEMMRRTQLELAAEYLLMAAVLIEIKSRLLLPKPPARPGEEGDEDPRAELVRRLLEYERMKLAARKLDELPLVDRDFSTARVWLERVSTARLPNGSPDDLRAAWAGLVARAKVNRHHLVTREQLSVRGEMSRLLRTLEPQRYAEFTTLFAPHADVSHLIVTFLALLELAREELITIAQAEPYAPIYVQRRSEQGFALAADVGVPG